jgi:serine/threonine protein kinase
MAPEQVLDTRHADARCDIYSLGCTLFYLLTGRKVYEGKGVVDRIMAHRTGAIPSIAKECKGASDEYDVLFRKMVAKQPDDRYQKMSDVCAALERLLKGEPVEQAALVEEPVAAAVGAAAAFGPADEGELIASVEAVEDVSLTNLPVVERETPSTAPGNFSINTAPTSRSARSSVARTGKMPKQPLDKRILIGAAVGIGIIAIAVVLWLVL